MIVTETIETRCQKWGTLYHTYSDSGVYIQNEDGAQYSEAFDISPDEHQYTETDIPVEEQSEEYALNKESE